VPQKQTKTNPVPQGRHRRNNCLEEVQTDLEFAPQPLRSNAEGLACAGCSLVA